MKNLVFSVAEYMERVAKTKKACQKKVLKS